LACIACLAYLRPVAHLLQMLHVVWSVFLCVGHTGELRKNGWTDWDAVWGLSHVGSRNHELALGQDPSHGKGQFWLLFGPLKSIGSLCRGVCMQQKGSFNPQ